jgi:hypothetical protein
MSADAWSAAVPSPVFGEPWQETADEFDLDIRWGELGREGLWSAYLPTAREVPGETCDTHAATCPDTCHGTCPDTCHGTCHATCQKTCGPTCDSATCAGTCVNTHCFTCESGCRTP